MKKETKTLLETILTYTLIICLILSPPILSIVMINQTINQQNERAEMLNELYEARTEAEINEAMAEIAFDLYEEKNAEVKELRKLKEVSSHSVYIKVENDGDFELIWKDDKGWNYLQTLGGVVVEKKCFGFVDEQFIDGFLGGRLVEFYKIP